MELAIEWDWVYGVMYIWLFCMNGACYSLSFSLLSNLTILPRVSLCKYAIKNLLLLTKTQNVLVCVFGCKIAVKL